MKNKKILMLANDYGTIYRYRKELILKLIEEDYDVSVSLPYIDKVEKIKDLGAEIIPTDVDRKSINPIKDIKLYFNYKKIIKEEKPDMVISYTIKPNVYGGMACTRLNIPYISNITGLGSTYYKGGWVKQIVSILYKIGLKNAKSVFFENEGNAKILVDDKTIKKDQVVVMNGAGVNLDIFKYCEMPPDNVTKFLFSGRIMKEKGVEELFYAIRKIKQEYKDKVEFHFIGWFEDDYEGLVNDLNSQGIIKFHGLQDDVIPFIKDCHCVVLPSYHEGMSNVLLEGAAMGRVIITSDIHGCKESVINKKTGWLCELQNKEDLYRKIKQFINTSYEEKKYMGILSRKYMENIFDKNNVVDLTIKEIEK